LKSNKATTRQPKKHEVQFTEVNLDEDVNSLSDTSEKSDSEEEEGDSAEFIDVLAVFDGKGEADDGSDSGGGVKQEVRGKPQMLKANEENMSEDGDEDEEQSDHDDDESHEDAIVLSGSEGEEDPSPEALASLENFISTLDPSRKRKAPVDDDNGTPVDTDASRIRKRRMIKERTEAGLENEFGAQGSGEVSFRS
jgi:U3 small nucleolar RNA-associated protein 14